MTPLALRLAPSLRSTGHSETLLAGEVCRRRAADNRPVYRFGFGQNPFQMPEHLVQALRDFAGRKEYVDVQGLPELRESVAGFHSALHQHAWNPDRVIIGVGSKILLYALMAAVRDADIALVTPCWVSYEPQAKLAGHRVYRLATCFEDRWRLRPAALDEFCRQRPQADRPLFIVLNYPGNPDGLSYSAEELAGLAGVLRRHGVIAVSDEIYGLLHHQGRHVSMADYFPEGTIVTSGLSKWCGAGGWRIGVAHVPEQLGADFLERVIGICSETISCAPAPIQHAAVAAYTLDERLQSFVQHQRAVFAEVGNRCAGTLRQFDVNVHSPEGGFYLFPDFCAYREKLAARGIHTGQQFTQALLDDTGVSLLPGSAFGMDEASLTARLAYVDFDAATVSGHGSCDTGNMEEGIRCLRDWLQA